MIKIREHKFIIFFLYYTENWICEIKGYYRDHTRIYASRVIYSFILFTMRATVNTPECRCVNVYPSFYNIHSINKVRITFPALISRTPTHRSYATAVADVVVTRDTEATISLLCVY